MGVAFIGAGDIRYRSFSFLSSRAFLHFASGQTRIHTLQSSAEESVHAWCNCVQRAMHEGRAQRCMLGAPWLNPMPPFSSDALAFEPLHPLAVPLHACSTLHIKGIRECDGARFVGLWSRPHCPIVPDPAAKAAEYGGKLFASAEELCADAEVDAVLVLTNYETHLKVNLLVPFPWALPGVRVPRCTRHGAPRCQAPRVRSVDVKHSNPLIPTDATTDGIVRTFLFRDQTRKNVVHDAYTATRALTLVFLPSSFPSALTLAFLPTSFPSARVAVRKDGDGPRKERAC
jgi:hypothetical protein